MNELSRIDLKYNILKQIILRVDFQGVLPEEFESVVIAAKTLLKGRGFSRLDESVEAESADDKTSVSPESANRGIKVFVFSNELRGYRVNLSTNFVVINVIPAAYIPYEEYADVFRDVVQIYREKVVLLTFMRLGFRKINFCFLKNISKLNDYFSERYLSYSNTLDQSDNMSISRKETLRFPHDYLINFNNSVEQGKLENNKIVYRVLIDTDVYIKKKTSIEDVFSVKSGMEKMNEILFQLFSSCLTCKMIDCLEGKRPLPVDDIEGITENE